MFPMAQRDLHGHPARYVAPPGVRGTESATSGSRKRKFTEQEDSSLMYLIGIYGSRDWKTIAWYMKGRTERQCRERFKYYLRPGIERPEWTEMEDQLLMNRYETIGPKWAQLATFFDGRTDIDVKNRYHRIQRVMKRSQKEDEEDLEIPKIMENLDGRLKFPSLTPGPDFMGMKGNEVAMKPGRPKRIICSNVSEQRLPETGN
jgi:hypothetical protein